MFFKQHIESLIASLRGVPSVKRSPGMDQPTLPIDALMNKILEENNIGKSQLVETIMKNWRTIIGDKFAARCVANKILKQTKLVVNVENATVRNELEFDKRNVLKRLQLTHGCEHFSEIIFRSS